MAAKGLGPVTTSPIEEKDRGKRMLGTALIVLGLIGWVSLMIYIVYQRTANGTMPSQSVIVTTIACWIVFFIGKSLIKFLNNKLEAPASEKQ
jgi:Kef-type K+ transport system membrane component KefB